MLNLLRRKKKLICARCERKIVPYKECKCMEFIRQGKPDPFIKKNTIRLPDKVFPRLWEDVDTQGTTRLKVFGGWVIYSSYEGTETMCFVPDPDHKWKLAPFVSEISEGIPKGINEQQEK